MSVYQKQHYEDVAGLLFAQLAPVQKVSVSECHAAVIAIDTLTTTAKFFADLFAADNPNFDRERFLRACGLEEK